MESLPDDWHTGMRRGLWLGLVKPWTGITATPFQPKLMVLQREPWFHGQQHNCQSSNHRGTVEGREDLRVPFFRAWFAYSAVIEVPAG